MISLFNSIKNEIYSNNKINWAGVLFFTSEPLALLAAYFLLQKGLQCLNNSEIFIISTFYTVIFTALGYVIRIPYMWDKPSALFFLVLNVIMWTIILGIWIKAFLMYKESEKSSSNKNNNINKNIVRNNNNNKDNNKDNNNNDNNNNNNKINKKNK